MEKIIGIYRIINTITGDFYIGSSKNIKERWMSHKKPSRWKKCPNNPMYLDMQKYGVDKFSLEILAEVEPEQLKKTEQEFIEKLQPTYNSNRASGWDVERHRERHKESNKEYRKIHKNELKEYNKEYTKIHKNELKEYRKEYDNQICRYNGKTLTLAALAKRFYRAGIEHPIIEAKKYLIL